MNRIYIAIVSFLLVALIGISGLVFLNKATRDLIDLFKDVKEAARGEHYNDVKENIEKVVAKWNKLEPILSSFKMHEDIDEVGTSIYSLFELLESQDFPSICLTCNITISKLHYILESELPTIKNLL